MFAHGVKQKTVAEVADVTPQAVTKWLKGGNVEPEPLERLATWVGLDYESMRLLVDRPRLKTTSRKRTDTDSKLKAELDEILDLYPKLNANGRDQVLKVLRFFTDVQFGDPERRERVQREQRELMAATARIADLSGYRSKKTKVVRTG